MVSSCLQTEFNINLLCCQHDGYHFNLCPSIMADINIRGTLSGKCFQYWTPKIARRDSSVFTLSVQCLIFFLFSCFIPLIFWPSCQVQMARGCPTLHSNFLQWLEAPRPRLQTILATSIFCSSDKQEQQSALPLGPTCSGGGETKLTELLLTLCFRFLSRCIYTSKCC